MGNLIEIIANRVECNKCGDLIESVNRHDLVWCSCGSTAVDGGKDYLRRVGDDWRDASITAPAELRVHVLENSGQVLQNVHHSIHCKGRPCPIHNRTDHSMRRWPQLFEDRVMVRVCQHWDEHIDPDIPDYHGCEGCDGCCRR